MFYDKFKELCDLKGVSVSKAASEIGLSNSTATKWKKTGATPDSSTIAKAASYFDVPTDYFMDDVIFGDSLENIIKEESDRLGISESELKKAFLQRRGLAKILNRESVSEYFDSVYKKAPTKDGEREVSDDDIMFALWGDSDDVDKDDLDDVKRYAAFVRERKKQK